MGGRAVEHVMELQDVALGNIMVLPCESDR